jgi:sterol desaturase/sphingolipid hydroxylase (fatty acid hydroxylase superfamily)
VLSTTTNALAANPFWQYRYFFAGVLLAAVLAESIVRLARFGLPLSTPRVLVNSGMWGAELFVRGATFGLRFATGTWLAQFGLPRQPFTIGTSVACYVLVDFIYYWRHRFLHSTSLGWAIHSTHHSSEEMTVLATVRLSWIESAIDYFFYIPLVLVGFDPLQVFFLVELNAASQLWCHTDTIGPIRALDPWLNTPFNHRIHHARARERAECNYGSTLMLWDKLFGTYRTGQRDLEYGIEGQRESLNPFRLQLGPLWQLLTRRTQ